MSLQLYIFPIAFSLVFVFFVIELVRRGSLREQYSLLWLGVGIVMLIFSASRGFLQAVANWFGVIYAPSILFLFAIVAAFILLLHITVVISRLTDKVVRLTQELGIASHRIAQLEGQLLHPRADEFEMSPLVQSEEHIERERNYE